MLHSQCTMYRAVPSGPGSSFSYVDVTDGLNEGVASLGSSMAEGHKLAYFNVVEEEDNFSTLDGILDGPIKFDSSGMRGQRKMEDGQTAGFSRDKNNNSRMSEEPGVRSPDTSSASDGFSRFKAHISRTSSGHDLSELSWSSRATTPTNMTTEAKTSRMLDNLSLHTPRISITPADREKAAGVPGSVLRRSSSMAGLIHYHNLETISLTELYLPPTGHRTPPTYSTDQLHANPDYRGGAQIKALSPLAAARLQVSQLYQSRSCPQTPPRQFHPSELAHSLDLPEVTARLRSNGLQGFQGRCKSPQDVYHDDNFMGPRSSDTESSEGGYHPTQDVCREGDVINIVEDNLSTSDSTISNNSDDKDDENTNEEEEDMEQCEAGPTPGVMRQRSSSVSFATLFKRCRYERDCNTVPGTPANDQDQWLDHELLVSRMEDLLCAERVSQMTKTYNDIEAVTRLLEEKERDLELAARIGQTLLSKNKELTSRAEGLEEQLSLASDKVNQLKHDLSMKDELLRIYNEDLEHEHSGDSTPNDKSGVVNVDFLEKKVKTLEDENLNLRLESAQLKSATDNYEEKEKKLVEDCIQQLGEVNQQVESLAEELHHKSEENYHQKEEITGLLSQMADLQKKIRKLTLENMDLHEKLTASTESQRKLTKELGSMQDKYDELFEMLEEAQDELRLSRGRHKLRASNQHHHAAYNVPTDSLASELETSLQQELSETNRRAQSWKVFETARAAKRAAAKAAEKEAISGLRVSATLSGQRESDSAQSALSAPSQGASAYPSDVESLASDGYSADMDSLYGSNPELGQPGIPGSNDLESALKRLAMRRANELNEKDFLEEEEERRHSKDQLSVSGATSPLKSPDPSKFRSPGSLSASSVGGFSGLSGPTTPGHYRISEKLQIVKPMEGSMTLRHWQHLATPHLGGIFEEREGVQIKGEKKLDLEEEVYSISDFEEDEDPSEVHTRREQEMGLIYTFIDSRVQHPGPYRGTGNLFGSRVPSAASLGNLSMSTEDGPLQASTPKNDGTGLLQAQSHNSSADSTQSTFSTSAGLGALLQGRENTGMGRALMRVSALSKTRTTQEPSAVSGTSVSPNSDFNQMVLSSRVSSSSSLSSSVPRNLPGSRTFEQAMREYEEKTKAKLADPSSQPPMFTPGMTGQGFLQQLKNKGYSLYGLWGGAGKGDSKSADSSTDEVTTPTTKPSADSVFSNGAGVGVLGALTNFRRNGMF